MKAWILAGCVLSGAFWVEAKPPRASEKIDQLVFDRLEDLGVQPSERCTDEVFLRRAHIDMIGTLPTAQEARRFLNNGAADKRERLIETLFERPEFADYWALKWCDLLRVKAEFPSKLWPNAVQAYYRWVRVQIAANTPYDEFTRALLTSSGSNFRVPTVNFYRAMPTREPEEIARIVALTFMGERAEGWERARWLGLAAFFGRVNYKGTAEWKEEIVFNDPSKTFLHPDTQQPVAPTLPNGEVVEIGVREDPRVAFTDWLVASDACAENICNRIWYWLMGRGIIHEPDDLRPDNPPQNRALLDFLVAELRGSDYDLRHIYRIILNSEAYQLSAIPNESNVADEVNFSHYLARRLEAEVLIDAICQITRTSESYSSDIPEPFTFIPENERAIRLSDGSITSPFLELYGRPSRDTGFVSERDDTPSASQKLHLLNSTHIQQKAQRNKALLGMRSEKRGKNKKPVNTWVSWEDALEHMYLTTLSRRPTEAEVAIVLEYARTSGLNRYEASVDVVWALLNSNEFIFRH